LSTNHTVYHYPGSGSVWQPISGHDVVQIAVDGAGNVFALGTNGTVYRYPGSGTVWTAVGTSGVSTADGSIWFQGSANAAGIHPVYRLRDGQLSQAGSMSGKLAVGSNGQLSLGTGQQALGLTDSSGGDSYAALVKEALSFLGKPPVGNGQCTTLVEQVLQ